MSSDFKVTLKIVLHTFKQYEIYTHRNGLGVSLERRTGSSRTLRRRGRTYSKHIQKISLCSSRCIGYKSIRFCVRIKERFKILLLKKRPTFWSKQLGLCVPYLRILLLRQGSCSVGRCVGTVETFVETVVETIHFQIETVETVERRRKL